MTVWRMEADVAITYIILLFSLVYFVTFVAKINFKSGDNLRIKEWPSEKNKNIMHLYFKSLES